MFVEGIQHVFFNFFSCIFTVSKTQVQISSDALQHNCQSKSCKMLQKLELRRVSLSSALGHRYFQSNQETMHEVTSDSSDMVLVAIANCQG